MYPFALLASLALVAPAVRAAIYVTQPVQSTTCTGGQSCEVDWVDDGRAPVLSSIGECDVAVYTGQMVLVQSLQSVDVSTTTSFTFTPDPAAGPNGQYYLVFTSTSIDYQGFSGSFTLTGMTGTTYGGGGGGSSAPTSTPTTTSSGSSSAGSSTPPSGTPSGPSGTSTPATVVSSPIPATSGTSAGLTTPTMSPPGPTTTPTKATTTTTTTTTKPPTTTTTTPTPSNAAGRVGASTSLGGLVAAFVLSYVLAF